jgi:hypothetical protein
VLVLRAHDTGFAAEEPDRRTMLGHEQQRLCRKSLHEYAARLDFLRFDAIDHFGIDKVVVADVCVAEHAECVKFWEAG